VAVALVEPVPGLPAEMTAYCGTSFEIKVSPDEQ
jgi:hypothetical protein